MNERIKELIAKASSWVEVDCDYGTDSEYQLDAKKFAELVAADCADICMELAAKCAGLPNDGALAVDCANLIKQDFGVEQ